MLVAELPDFTKPIDTGELRIYRPFSVRAPYALAPSALELAKDADGRPLFGLELVRGQMAGFPPEPFGALDMTLQLGFRLDDALASLRRQNPSAVVTRAPVVSGTIRLVPRGELRDIPPELLRPVAASWLGSGSARYLMHLSDSAATYLRAMLQQAKLTLDARATLSIAGVAPRLPLIVTIDPAGLRTVLRTTGASSGPTTSGSSGTTSASSGSTTSGSSGTTSASSGPTTSGSSGTTSASSGPTTGMTSGAYSVAREELVALLLRPVAELAFIKVAGDAALTGTTEFAQALTDWIVARLGTGTFGVEPGTERAVVDLSAIADVAPGGRLEWDLSQPIETARPLTIDFSPLAALSNVDTSTLVRTTIVPPFFTGVLPIDVIANLPERMRGLERIGVEIAAAPNPPHRPQELKASVEFNGAASATRVMLRLSPAEPPAYTYRAFAVVRESNANASAGETNAIVRQDGAAVAHGGSSLALSVADFPVDFVPLELSPSLAAIADLGVSAQWTAASGALRSDAFVLTAQERTQTLALMRGWSSGALALELRPKTGASSLALGERPLAPVFLDLCALPGYGLQTVTLRCTFDAGVQLYAIDLVAEALVDTPSEIAVAFFTPQTATRTWSYVAHSPFAAGYFFRPNSSSGTPAPWSQRRLASDLLELHATAVAGAGASATTGTGASATTEANATVTSGANVAAPAEANAAAAAGANV